MSDPLCWPAPLTFGERDKQPLLLLHGFMGSGRDWQKLAAELAAEFFCICPDLPGHGQNLADSYEWNMDNCLQALLNMLDEMAIPAVHLLGYSMGGRLALYLAIHASRRFRSVVLESASPGLEKREGRRERMMNDQLLAAKIKRLGMTQFINEWYQLPLFASLAMHEDLPEMKARRVKNRPKALAKSLAEMGTGAQPSLWPKLADNKLPLLLLVGEKDRKFVSIAKKMAVMGNQIIVREIAGCGHNIHFENPAAFLQETRTFFDINSQEES